MIRGVGLVAAGYAVAAGALGLAGWALGAPRLLDWTNTGIVMKANTAVCAMALGMAAILALVAPARAWVVRVLALPVMAVGALTLFEHLAHLNIGIDTLLFHEPPGATATIAPGRMGPPASLSFTILGTAVLLSTRGTRARRWAAALALVPACMAALALVGYLYGASALYAVGHVTGIALQTALLIAALGIAVVTLVPEHGLMAALCRDDPGGVTFRRLLLPIVAVPVALGWLRVLGQELGLYDTAFGTAARTLVEIVFFVGLVWWTASGISRHTWAARRAERALRASEERLSQALAASRTVAWSWDLGSDSFASSDNARDMLGLPPIVPASVIWAAIHPDDVPGLRAMVERAIAERGRYQGDIRFVSLADGRVHRLENRARVECDGAGRPVRVIGTVTDVTERRQAEERARENQARLAAFLEQLPLGCGLTDPDGRWVECNSILRRFVGDTSPARDPEGPRHWRAQDAAGRPLEQQQWPTARALRGETVSPGVDFVHTDDDGSERWMRVSSAPFRDEAGRIVGAITVLEDIDARTRAAEELREREALLRTVTTEARVGLVLVDRAGRYRFANAMYTELLGLPEGDVVGKRVEDVLGPLYDQVRPRFEHGLRGERVRYELTVPVHPGTGVAGYYDVFYEPRWVGSRVAELVVVITDVTARKTAENALLEADRRKDEFLATLAHELRNPLAPLRNGLEIVRRSGDDPAAVARAHAMMERQLAQMVHLVDDLLDVSRVSRGKIELRRACVPVAAAIDSALETARPLLDAQHHELVVHAPGEPIYIDGDVTRLGQVFANLLGNAAKYTNPGGHISLSVERAGAEAVVRVRDDGLGIPRDMLTRIFEMFTQVDRTLDRAGGGLGVGLTLVKQLVEMHGGSVSVASPAPGGGGKGTEFAVRLPVVAAPALAPRPALAARGEPAEAEHPHLRILVADDNLDAADSLAELLADMGNEIRMAHDGEQALAAAAAFRPDVVLLDIGMPKLDGYEVGRRIRSTDWGRAMLLVALTGWGQEEDRRRSAEAGFDIHLVKPIDVPALEELLAHVAHVAHEAAPAASHPSP